MRFAVETWAPEYGSSIEAEELVDATERVDAKVERPLADWAPITVADPGAAGPRPVRRRRAARSTPGLDPRGDRVHAGVCASVAAGVVECAGDGHRDRRRWSSGR